MNLVKGIFFLTGMNFLREITLGSLIQNEVELTQELDKLTNDAEYIKKIAQEKFHMVKPGEKVFRVIDRKKTN